MSVNFLVRVCIAVMHVSATILVTGCNSKSVQSGPAQCKACEATAKRVEATLVHPTWNWSEVEFYKFCMSSNVTEDGIGSLWKAVGLDGKIPGDREKEVRGIQKQVIWVSSNILTYPFRDKTKVNYHELCRWVASELGVDEWVYKTQPTLVLERAICEKLWADIWDRLTEEQREALLRAIDPEGRVTATAVITMSGSAVLAALSTTVIFSGFAFYTTMSVTICTVAGWVGVTLPFAVYTTASSLVAFLSGPVGWALIAVGVGASVAALGRANVEKTARFIVQTHLLKVAALIDAGGDAPSVPARPW